MSGPPHQPRSSPLAKIAKNNNGFLIIEQPCFPSLRRLTDLQKPGRLLRYRGENWEKTVREDIWFCTAIILMTA